MPATDTARPSVRSHGMPAPCKTAQTSQAQRSRCAPISVILLLFCATTTTRTSAANSSRFSIVLRCARYTRPTEPVNVGKSLRLAANVDRPTCIWAAIVAITTCGNGISLKFLFPAAPR